MTRMDEMDKMEEWARAVRDEYARASEHLTDAELTERNVVEEAHFFTLATGWLIAHPDDPQMRQYLLEDHGCDPEFADLILAKMRSIASESDAATPGWDEWAPGEVDYWKEES